MLQLSRLLGCNEMRVFNLSLDDFSPHPKAGLDFESIGWCDKLIEKWPEIKINLFVPTAFARLGEEPCFLYNNPEWIKRVKKLPKNYRLNLHGHFHRRTDGKHPNSNNDEMQFLTRREAEILFNASKGVFGKAKLLYFKTIRPPGWKISRSACEILAERGFLIAGNSTYYQKYEGQIHNLRWVSYNWDLNNPCNIKNEDIIAYGHTSNWTSNYMCKKTFDYVVSLLESDSFVFRFLEDLA